MFDLQMVPSEVLRPCMNYMRLRRHHHHHHHLTHHHQNQHHNFRHSYPRRPPSADMMATHLVFVVVIIVLMVFPATTSSSYAPSSMTGSSKDRSKCVRYYHTEKISHPRKKCQSKIVLMSRCAGQCEDASSADPVVSFKSHLRHPFRYRCQSCQDQVSIMKAVLLQCQGNERIYATYRYILSCECAKCKSGNR